MPFPNEHSARITKPNYKRYARKNDEFGKGIDAIYGIRSGKAELQAIRFNADKFSPSEAKAWLNSHGHKSIISFTPAKKTTKEDAVPAGDSGGKIGTGDIGPYFQPYLQWGDPKVPGKNKKLLRRTMSAFGGKKNTIAEKIEGLLESDSDKKYKVNLNNSYIKSQPDPYKKLLQREISKGKGYVRVREEKGDEVGIYADGTYNYFMGLIWVPKEALIKV